MIKYSFLLAPGSNTPFADKPKRNAKVFKKTMPIIVETIQKQHKKLKNMQLLSININKDLKLCSVRFSERDYIYNIIVKKFPGPSDRFYLKILKEMHEARLQSGFGPKNLGVRRRFEIELKKVIEKFNESEIQYKYFMKKLHIREEQKKEKARKESQRIEQERLNSQVEEGVNMARVRKTFVTSELPKGMQESAQGNAQSENNGKRGLGQEESRHTSEHEVVLVQTGNQGEGSDPEMEQAVGLHGMTDHSLAMEPNSQNFERLVTTGTIQNLQKQTLGIDSGSHYSDRKTKMLVQDEISQLLKLNILPEVNSQSESSSRSDSDFSSESDSENESRRARKAKAKKRSKKKKRHRKKSNSDSENSDDNSKSSQRHISGVKVTVIKEISEDSDTTSGEEVQLYSQIQNINSDSQDHPGQSPKKDNLTVATNADTSDNEIWDRTRPGRATQNFMQNLPELDCSQVITVNLEEGMNVNKELIQFEEDPEMRPSHLSKKCCGLLWWNDHKTMGQNLMSNMRNNPYFRVCMIVVIFVFLIITIGVGVYAVTDDKPAS